MADFFKEKTVKTPLVHCITNYVTVNDCANAVLACGGSPIMADDSNEVEDITFLCDALVLNIGTLNGRTVEAMEKAGVRANELHHPVLLDPVGAGASRMRTQTAQKLLSAVQFQVIRGNSSEIKTLYDNSGATRGVDAAKEDEVTAHNLEQAVAVARELSKKTGAIVVTTGKTDIVTDGTETFLVKNGCSAMGGITGTGCMLSAILGVSLGFMCSDVLQCVADTVSYMGICGELACEKNKQMGGGTASFRVHLMDYLSKLTKVEFLERKKVERY